MRAGSSKKPSVSLASANCFHSSSRPVMTARWLVGQRWLVRHFQWMVYRWTFPGTAIESQWWCSMTLHWFRIQGVKSLGKFRLRGGHLSLLCAVKTMRWLGLQMNVLHSGKNIRGQEGEWKTADWAQKSDLNRELLVRFCKMLGDFWGYNYFSPLKSSHLSAKPSPSEEASPPPEEATSAPEEASPPPTTCPCRTQLPPCQIGLLRSLFPPRLFQSFFDISVVAAPQIAFSPSHYYSP